MSATGVIFFGSKCFLGAKLGFRIAPVGVILDDAGTDLGVSFVCIGIAWGGFMRSAGLHVPAECSGTAAAGAAGGFAEALLVMSMPALNLLNAG